MTQPQSIDEVLPFLLEILRRNEPDTYLRLLTSRPLPAAGHAALTNPSHPYWETDQCFALYDHLLKELEGYCIETEIQALLAERENASRA